MSSGTTSFRLLQNLTILGAPGSGKGFYGQLLAQAWGVPLITTSTVLRGLKNKSGKDDVDLDSGRLVDCQMVSDALLAYLSSRDESSHSLSFILDGFPRTALQTTLMTNQWPLHLQVHIALHLNVPDQVCLQKSLGRRYCHICQQPVNVANVQYGKFDLPPTIPPECTHSCHAATSRPETEWSTRKDDTTEIIQERLRLHHEHYDPIIDYYRKEHRLLQFTPYKGLRDLDVMQQTCQDWLKSSSGLPRVGIEQIRGGPEEGRQVIGG